MIAAYIALAVVGFAGVACLVLRKTVRTRLRAEIQLRDDPDIHEWLVMFNWTPKILYVPTIAASILAAGAMYLKQSGWLGDAITPGMIGGVWFALFFANFLIEEYELNVKILLIGMLCVAVLLLWLHLLESVRSFLGLFGHLGVSVSATGYFLVAIIGLITVLVSWLKGLFYYVALTPNYMNLQEGPTESSEQISREDYNTRVDTGDFLERLLGFGRIMVTFKDQKRPPIVLLVWGIRKKAEELESIRGTIAIDRQAG
jgi:hypothetical protein